MALSRALFISCALAAGMSAALAQEGGAIIDQGRLDRAAPQAREAVAPRTRGRVEPTARTIAPFTLNEVRIEGSTLPAAAFARAIAPLRGQSFDGASVNRIAEAIGAVYAQSDIALYTILIPEQDFANGVARIVVIEGHIGNVAITGDVAGNIDLARHYAADLTRERPLRRHTMERALLLLSDIPGLETQVQMAPASDPGVVRMGLGLKRTRVQYELGLDNRGSQALGRTQLFASLIGNGLTRLGDQTRLTFSADSKFERFTYAALSHRQPIGHDGASLTGRLSWLETEPAEGLSGTARAGGLVYAYPLIRSERRNATLSAAFDGLNSDNAFLGDAIATERTRVLRAAASFSDARARRAFRASAIVSKGLDSIGARASDASTVLDFTKLNAGAEYDRALSRSWIVRLDAAAQLTADPLPASERFTLGGAKFGRAFEAASASGDDGAAGAAELAWRAPRDAAWISEFYGFADGGRVWREDRPATPGATRNLASAGVGARLKLGPRAGLDLEAAKSLEEPIPGVEERGWRLGWALNARF